MDQTGGPRKERGGIQQSDGIKKGKQVRLWEILRKKMM